MSETTLVISPAKVINSDRLHEEIQAAVANYTAISITSYTTGGLANNLMVHSPLALSGADQTTIANLVTAHVATPSPLVTVTSQPKFATTANATPFILASAVVDINTLAELSIMVFARGPAGACGLWDFKVGAKRGGGNLAAIGTAPTIAPLQIDSGIASATVTVTVTNPDKLNVVVTGIALTSISWGASAVITRFVP